MIAEHQFLLVNTYLRCAGGDWYLATSLDEAYVLINYVPPGVLISVASATEARPRHAAKVIRSSQSDARATIFRFREEESLEAFIVVHHSDGVKVPFMPHSEEEAAAVCDHIEELDDVTSVQMVDPWDLELPAAGFVFVKSMSTSAASTGVTDIRELAAVELLFNLPTFGLAIGDIGTVITVHPAPSIMYEVDFCDSDGRSIAQVVVPPEGLRLV